MGSKDDFAFDLGPQHVAALERALATVKARGLDAGDFGPDDFDLSAIACAVDHIRDEVLDGRGVLLVRGFPVERHDARREPVRGAGH